MTSANPKPVIKAARGARLRRFIPLVIIVILLGVFFARGGQDYINLETLRAHRGELQNYVADNFYMALGAFMITYAALVSISFPGASYMSIFGGFLFGLYVGTVAVVLSATLGATIIFVATRHAIGDVLLKRAEKHGMGPQLAKFEAGLKDNAFSYLFILRLVPLFPFFLVNIVPAFFGVSLRTFVLATAFGIVPGSFVYVSVGDGIGAVFDAGADAQLSGLMTEPRILIPVIGLVLLALIPVFYKRFKRSDA